MTTPIEPLTRRLTDAQITEALDVFTEVAECGRAARPNVGACDHMYDKGWDDCLRGVRSWLRLAGERQ